MRCDFIDDGQATVQLNCDDAVNYNSDSNCTSMLFGENPLEIGRLNVNTIKIGSCQRFIEPDWDEFTKNFKNIERFDVSSANLNHLSPSFWKLTNMKQINASHNELSRLPIFASAIRIVDFSYNNIREFHISTGHSTPIESLNLSHNKISNVGRPHEYFMHLETLDLSWNEITTISSYLLDDCPKLKSLRLEHNKITTFTVNEVSSGFLTLMVNFGDLTPW